MNKLEQRAENVRSIRHQLIKPAGTSWQVILTMLVTMKWHNIYHLLSNR